jgi:putative iron-only hydrogenase system regulator
MQFCIAYIVLYYSTLMGVIFLGVFIMETRVAVLAIIVENTESVEELNKTLHEYGKFIIGRMGLPYREKGIHVVSVAIDAPQDKISALAGKVGKIDGISVKTAYSNVVGV